MGSTWVVNTENRETFPSIVPGKVEWAEWDRFPLCPHQITPVMGNSPASESCSRAWITKALRFVFIPDSQAAQREKLGKVAFRVSEDPLDEGLPLGDKSCSRRKPLP